MNLNKIMNKILTQHVVIYYYCFVTAILPKNKKDKLF